MKIRIQDFGPIRDFTFDLDKDLHLLYGKNGTGKSYAVCCIYLFIKILFVNEKDYPLTQIFLREESKSIDEYGNRAIEELRSKNNINFSKVVEHIITFSLSKTIVSLENTLLNTYGLITNLNNQLSAKPYRFFLYTEDFSVCLTNDGKHNKAPKFKLQKQIELTKDNNGILRCSFGDEEILVGPIDGGISTQEICTKVLKKIIIEASLSSINLHFLPASRSGLYQGLNSFGPIIAQLSKQRNLIGRKLELPTLSETVSDYYLALASIETLEDNQSLKKVIDSLEKNVLDGEVTYNTSDQKIAFKPNGTNLTLDLATVSSMVAELSPVVTFLKYIIRDRSDREVLVEGNNDIYDILFIEEPEAHLHPEAQVKLMKILAELPKHNIKVVMTSHSNYMFNKLTNLILEKKVDPDKVATYHMVMTDKGSVVKDDMPVTDEGIEDSNFVTVAEQLYEERMQLLDEIEE